MTPFTKVYDAFLSKILDDEWNEWTDEEIAEDMRQLLESSIPNFKFPRISLERDDEGFFEDLESAEIQILATYMKCEWLNRNIATWENIRPLYLEKDFSQANLLDKLMSTLIKEREQALRMESIYYRSIKGRSFNYGQLAGKQ